MKSFSEFNEATKQHKIKLTRVGHGEYQAHSGDKFVANVTRSTYRPTGLSPVTYHRFTAHVNGKEVSATSEKDIKNRIHAAHTGINEEAHPHQKLIDHLTKTYRKHGIDSNNYAHRYSSGRSGGAIDRVEDNVRGKIKAAGHPLDVFSDVKSRALRASKQE